MESSLETQSLNEKDPWERKAKKSKKHIRNDEYLLNNRNIHKHWLRYLETDTSDNSYSVNNSVDTCLRYSLSHNQVIWCKICSKFDKHKA